MAPVGSVRIRLLQANPLRTRTDTPRAGEYQTFSIGSDGTITASYSNGQNQAIGQLAVATVNNQQGLSSVGSDDYKTSTASGGASMGVAGTGGRGTIEGGETERQHLPTSDQCDFYFMEQLSWQWMQFQPRIQQR